ncbi:MAG TPA: hypothetical protein VHL58_07880 [Thermoanaerobaculia bacterium]|nr:hypothetical protein [Thermoanaerobaculia bacterium]
MDMEKHVTVLGVVYVALGILGCLAALLVFVVIAGGGLISGDSTAIGITASIATVIAGFLFLLSVPTIIGGVGLLRRAPWSRMLVMILGVMNLINVPIGTAVGIYSLWVLLNDSVTPMFRRPAFPSPF